MRWLRRVRRFFARHLHQRITRAGLGFSITTAAVGILAFLSANNLLFLLLALLLGGLMLSSFLSRLSLAGLELDFLFPEHVPSRRKVPARMSLHNHKSWMPSFSIHVAGTPGSAFSSAVYFPMIPGGGTVVEPVEVLFERRGLHKEHSFVLRSGFPFGFAVRTDDVPTKREVLVYPCLDPQPGFDNILRRIETGLEAFQRGRGHDFHRIRPYEALESARHVDWKASAHTGELQVREFAREQEPLVEIFLDLAVPLGQGGWFDRAVDCCAFLCWEVALKAARLRFRTQEFDLSVPVEGDVHAILGYLAEVEPRGRGTAPGPGWEEGLQVVVSAAPERFVAAGWREAHCLGPDSFRAGAP